MGHMVLYTPCGVFMHLNIWGPFEGGLSHVTSCVFFLPYLDSMISAQMKSRENDPLRILFESSTETLPYWKFLVSATTKISFLRLKDFYFWNRTEPDVPNYINPILNLTKLALMVFFPYGPDGPLGQEFHLGRGWTRDSFKIVRRCALWQRDSKVKDFVFFLGNELGLF